MKIIEAISILKNSCLENDEIIRKELNLSPAEMNGLLRLEKNECLNCQALSKKLGLSVSRGSRVINKLIEKGYFEESKEESDKRCSKIKLSDTGIKIKSKLNDLIDQCEKKIISKMKKSEIKNVKDTLEKLISII